jgi:hypothetical protein
MATTYGRRDWDERDTVAAAFQSSDGAREAVQELKDRGFSDAEIGILARDRDQQGQIIEDTGGHAAEGAAAGALGGGILGGILGALIGMGALVIPGVGPVVAGGALAATFGVTGGTAIAGAGVGVVAGGIVGALVGLGIPKHEAEYLEEGFREGRVLVTVSAPGRSGEVADVLERHGGDTGAHLYEGAEEIRGPRMM